MDGDDGGGGATRLSSLRFPFFSFHTNKQWRQGNEAPGRLRRHEMRRRPGRTERAQRRRTRGRRPRCLIKEAASEDGHHSFSPLMTAVSPPPNLPRHPERVRTHAHTSAQTHVSRRTGNKSKLRGLIEAQRDAVGDDNSPANGRWR